MIGVLIGLVKTILGGGFTQEERGFRAATELARTGSDAEVAAGLTQSYSCPDPDDFDDAWRQVLETELKGRGWSDRRIRELS